MSVWEDVPTGVRNNLSNGSAFGTNSALDQQMAARGYTMRQGGYYSNGQQNIMPSQAQSMMARGGNLDAMSNASNYNAGVNYTSAVSPYLTNATNSADSVDTTNTYETDLLNLLKNPDSIANSGAYKFAFDQGEQALERSAAAKGMMGSGNVLAELTKYGQGMASQQYNTEADRLAGLAGNQKNYILGMKQAANNKAGTNLAAGNLALNAANAQSNDYWNANKLATTNALGNGYTKQAVW